MATTYHPVEPLPTEQSPLTIVLTGSVGAFSDPLARALSAHGHHVIQVPSDQPDRARSMFEVRHESIEPNRLREAVARADATILLTGLGPLIATVDDAAALDVILSAARSGATLIEVSAFGVFGDQDSSPVDEQSTPDPAPGAEALLSAEERTLNASDWLRTVVVRAGLVYAPGGGLIVEALVTAARAAGESRYVGQATDAYPLIHLDDLLSLLVNLVRNPRGRGIFHAVSEVIEAEMLAQLIADAAGVEPVRALSPAEFLKLVAPDLAPSQAPGRVNVQARNTRGTEIGWEPTGQRLVEAIADPAITQQTPTPNK